MRTQAIIAAVTLVTAAGCSDKDKKPAAEQADDQARAQGKDDQQETPEVTKPTTFEVSLRREGTATVAMKVPDGWVTNDRIRIGKGWRPAELDDVWLTVELGCSGSCEAAEIPGNIEPIVAYKRRGHPVIGPSSPNEGVADVEQELIEDTQLEGGHLIVRRLTPPKEMMDPPKPMLEVFCYRHQADMPFYVSVTGKGPAAEAKPFQDAMVEACRSLEIVDWKAEE